MWEKLNLSLTYSKELTGKRILGNRLRQCWEVSLHQRIHIGERPCLCDACHKTLIHECTLHGHKRSHVEKKTYRCVDCGKCFNCKRNLTAHQRIYLGNKPRVSLAVLWNRNIFWATSVNHIYNSKFSSSHITKLKGTSGINFNNLFCETSYIKNTYVVKM